MDTRKKIFNILIEKLQLEIDDVDHVDYSMNLFESDEEEGFGLDSVDALEIVVAVKKEFGVDLKNVQNIESILKSIDTLASYIEEQQQKE